ncbi:hypothetical protein HDV00_003469 [Rhizophlyctis rosea]|nr:hypothetical protein HDV00_003469 [Rhizophlyctis rosea]
MSSTKPPQNSSQRIPNELIEEVASYLPLIDLPTFRAASKDFRFATHTFLARYILKYFLIITLTLISDTNPDNPAESFPEDEDEAYYRVFENYIIPKLVRDFPVPAQRRQNVYTKKLLDHALEEIKLELKRQGKEPSVAEVNNVIDSIDFYDERLGSGENDAPPYDLFRPWVRFEMYEGCSGIRIENRDINWQMVARKDGDGVVVFDSKDGFKPFTLGTKSSGLTISGTFSLEKRIDSDGDEDYGEDAREIGVLFKKYVEFDGVTSSGSSMDGGVTVEYDVHGNAAVPRRFRWELEREAEELMGELEKEVLEGWSEVTIQSVRFSINHLASHFLSSLEKERRWLEQNPLHRQKRMEKERLKAGGNK